MGRFSALPVDVFPLVACVAAGTMLFVLNPEQSTLDAAPNLGKAPNDVFALQAPCSWPTAPIGPCFIVVKYSTWPC